MVELVLDLPALGHRLVRAGQQERAGQEGLAERAQQRADHGMVGDPHPDGLLLRVREPAGDFLGRRQDERVGPRCRGLDRAERRVVEVHELAELREVGADEREVVLAVEVPDGADAVRAGVAAEQAAQCVAGVCRVGDQCVVVQQRDDLADGPWLRIPRMDVEVLRHALSVGVRRRRGQRWGTRRWSQGGLPVKSPLGIATGWVATIASRNSRPVLPMFTAAAAVATAAIRGRFGGINS